MLEFTDDRKTIGEITRLYHQLRRCLGF